MPGAYGADRLGENQNQLSFGEVPLRDVLIVRRARIGPSDNLTRKCHNGIIHRQALCSYVGTEHHREQESYNTGDSHSSANE